MLARVNAIGSRTADVLIANSHAGAAHVSSLGYPTGRLIVVPNGIDTDRFRPDPERRRRQRADWAINADQRIIGLAARLDPMKDHANFVRAAKVAFHNGIDLATSSSAFGEGFSNAIGEAMACGTPCVVTDVGDSARIVGTTGRVVAPRDPEALGQAWDVMLAATQSLNALACRRRIVESFSLEALCRNTERALGL